VFALLVLVLADHPSPFNISGVSVSANSGGVPLRREITELQAEGGAQWFVKAPCLALEPIPILGLYELPLT
jgi:hypothetical protein